MNSLILIIQKKTTSILKRFLSLIQTKQYYKNTIAAYL